METLFAPLSIFARGLIYPIFLCIRSGVFFRPLGNADLFNEE
jgi:hypothetical protein